MKKIIKPTTRARKTNLNNPPIRKKGPNDQPK
jgi:hypothetical protein